MKGFLNRKFKDSYHFYIHVYLKCQLLRGLSPAIPITVSLQEMETITGNH